MVTSEQLERCGEVGKSNPLPPAGRSANGASGLESDWALPACPTVQCARSAAPPTPESTPRPPLPREHRGALLCTRCHLRLQRFSPRDPGKEENCPARRTKLNRCGGRPPSCSEAVGTSGGTCVHQHRDVFGKHPGAEKLVADRYIKYYTSGGGRDPLKTMLFSCLCCWFMGVMRRRAEAAN